MYDDDSVQTATRLGGLEGDLDFAQLPAPQSAQEYSRYIQAFVGRRTVDPERMQERAIRIGRLLGERGYYSFKAGKGRVEGGSVQLARALANEWGLCAFGVEVERIEGRRAFMRGVCVDFAAGVVVSRGYVSTLTAPSKGFARDEEQRARWEAMQIQAGGSKALRNAIFDCLPDWYSEPAILAAKDEAAKGVLRKGETIDSAREKALKTFADLGFGRDRLTAFLGKPVAEWLPSDIADLRALLRAAKSGDTNLEEELTVEVAQPDPTPPAPAPEPEPEPAKRAKGVDKALAALKGGTDA